MSSAAALRAERTKFFSVRSLPWPAVTAVIASTLMALLFVVSLPITQGRTLSALPPAEVIGAALVGIDVAAIVLMVVGASFAGSEYSTGLAQPTFLLTARRGRVVVAKAVVVAAVALVVAAVTAVLCTLAGQLALLVAGLPAAPLDAALVRLALGSAVSPVFYALVGLAAGLVLRSTGGGVVVALAVLALPTVLSWIPGLDALVRLLPGAALHGIAGASDPGTAEYLAVAPAALSIVGWTMVFGALALWRVGPATCERPGGDEMPDARPLTFTEEARRRQIIDCTIELVAERGPARASLSGIAARAGISKAAVLYHFASKDAVMEATTMHVITGFAEAVGERVDAADGPEEMLVAYLRGAVGYLREHPQQVRVLVEGLVRDRDGERALAPGSAAGAGRWQGVARILELGHEAGVFRAFDIRALALVIGGALDGVVAEWLGDPAFDLSAAAAELETAVLLAVRAERPT
ncbi:TetR/AcrR family transcriptional regulator [Pseudonocardia nigra]|uniref:TetR/AcrR family transcriptional regulator n=1 Tax=Pseudonocardia nigra TaxID=1921578 RepID=UPI0027E24CA1|nr:TetR/AcrR family transcriptional regulator [Pseudonocardia nigra]